MKHEKKKYIIVFLITAAIFLAVFLLVDTINGKKIDSIDRLQRKITADLLATETQFDLLKNAPCKSVNSSILSQELNTLGDRLAFMETEQGGDNENVEQLKKYYSLLQVKDYLLMQEAEKSCDIKTDSIVYFYTQNCRECEKQGYVLTELKKEYPWLRIYSFDRDLDYSIIDTFVGLYELDDVAPALLINEVVYTGLQSREVIESHLPAIVERKELEMIQSEIEDFINNEESLGAITDLNFISFEDGEALYSYSVDVEGEMVEKKLVLIYDKDENKVILPLEK